MSRIAALDVGSNSVLLCVGEPLPQGDYRVIYDTAHTSRLGEGLHQSGRLTPQAMRRTAEILDGCRRKAEILNVSIARAAATAAVREAENQDEFLIMAEGALGFPLEVLSGEREAELTFSGVAGPAYDDPLLIIDLGGASTELVLANEGKLERVESMPVGAARLKEAIPSEDMLSYFVRMIQVIPTDLGPRTSHGRRVTVVGGTVTTYAAIRRKLTRYDAELVEGQEFTRQELAAMVEQLQKLSVADLIDLPGLAPNRVSIITSGGILLIQILEELGVEHFSVSSRGLRHGILREIARAGGK